MELDRAGELVAWIKIIQSLIVQPPVWGRADKWRSKVSLDEQCFVYKVTQKT